MSSQAPRLHVVGPEPGPVDLDRPPLLFVPGLGHEAHCWDHWREAATAAGYPAYAMSLRGHGLSAGNLRASRLRHYRDDVIRTVADLPVAPVLVGHSMGGLVAAQAAARTQVRALVLVAAVPSRPAVRSFLHIARQHPFDALGVLAGRSLPLRTEYMFEKLTGPEVDLHLARCREESPWAQLQLVMHRKPALPLGSPPVLAIGTRADRLVAISDVRATARRYDAELVELDGIGHNLMQDVGREDTWAAVASWLDRILDPAGRQVA